MSNGITNLIVRTPGILGGQPRIDGTRLSVRRIAILYKHGFTPEEIADQYEQLTLAQIYAALSYYHANQKEIEIDIAAEEAEYDRLEKEHHQAKMSA